ncbi:hypothetical protein CCY99_03045 [Helicobacter sp. 16-1353]|uniref:hypothetical protein n=1 Tax=Helicobacter sp. 16-1353 TaxID=2004996 RepID=UPI000DCE2616|nr:hypothetical protein [Helicobacter sp. 16-1353]RAX54753.1 hypothetical protein CCY99_03045 [Helicobacter sp. 16-1353]
MRSLKNFIKQKIQNVIGVNEVNTRFNFLMSYNIIKELDMPREQKEAILLSMYPGAMGGIQLSYNIENIKKYLNLIRPICVSVGKLSRIGGENDGGYVMLAPPR